jgi:hypothetical protein
MSKRTHLSEIAEQQRRIDEMAEHLSSAVFQARLAGHSWAEIGAAIGQSKQTAFNRYSAYCDARLAASEH